MEKLSIEKLCGSENYASWSNDLMIILNHYECWSWIEGENENPPNEFLESTDPSTGTSTKVPNPDYTVWKKGSNEAMFHIIMTCEQKVKDQIRRIMLPVTTHAQPLPTDIPQLRTDLFRSWDRVHSHRSHDFPACIYSFLMGT